MFRLLEQFLGQIGCDPCTDEEYLAYWESTKDKNDLPIED